MNLLETLYYVTYSLDRGIPVDKVLLDFAKLLLELQIYGILRQTIWNWQLQ